MQAHRSNFQQASSQLTFKLPCHEFWQMRHLIGLEAWCHAYQVLLHPLAGKTIVVGFGKTHNVSVVELVLQGDAGPHESNCRYD